MNDLRNMIAHGENIFMRYSFTSINLKILGAIATIKDYTDITDNQTTITSSESIKLNLFKNKISKGESLTTEEFKDYQHYSNKNIHIKKNMNNLSIHFPKLYPIHKISKFHNEKRSFDTFYPYFLIIDFFIGSLKLKSFDDKLTANIKSFYQLSKDNCDYLGIKKDWINHL